MLKPRPVTRQARQLEAASRVLVPRVTPRGRAVACPTLIAAARVIAARIRTALIKPSGIGCCPIPSLCRPALRCTRGIAIPIRRSRSPAAPRRCLQGPPPPLRHDTRPTLALSGNDDDIVGGGREQRYAWLRGRWSRSIWWPDLFARRTTGTSDANGCDHHANPNPHANLAHCRLQTPLQQPYGECINIYCFCKVLFLNS